MNIVEIYLVVMYALFHVSFAWVFTLHSTGRKIEDLGFNMGFILEYSKNLILTPFYVLWLFMEFVAFIAKSIFKR